MNDPLVIFDCDGVLVDSEPLAAAAYERVYRKHGLHITRDVVGHCIGMKQDDIIIRIAELTGHMLPDQARGDIWRETKILLERELEPTRGITAFLDRLIGPRCVASSSSIERIAMSLRLSGIEKYFGPDVFSSSMVSRGKPAPDIFLFAAGKMKAPPETSIVIEDSPFGIQGAVAAGMTAIGFTGGSHSFKTHAENLRDAGAHAVCASWSEVEAEFSRRTRSGTAPTTA